LVHARQLGYACASLPALSGSGRSRELSARSP
jgi:hypothetical protein